MSFLDLITNYLGATTILLLVAMKYYQETPGPSIKHMVDGNYDPLHSTLIADVNTQVAGVKEGDSIMVVVRSTQVQYKPGQQNGGGGNTPRDPSICGIYPKIMDIRCDNNGTANDPSDDQFTFDLQVEKNGPCRGSRWKSADGQSGRYNATVHFGPFLIREGNREIRVSDDSDPSVQANITAYAPPPCSGNAPAPEQCTIYAAAQNVTCNGQGSKNAQDDTYTFELLVTKNGPCGSSWAAAGKTGQYTSPVLFGPYKISQGVQKITVTDAKNSSISTVVTVNPPAPCSNGGGGGDTQWPQPPGQVNFYIKWGDTNQKVDLYVEKGGNWAYHENPNSRINGIGQWSSLKSTMFDRTDVETVKQNKPVPGVYRVYAYYKGAKSGADKPSVNVDFYALSSLKPEGNRKYSVSVPNTDKSPKRGGGKLLATVTVLADGSLQVTGP
ncbi:MAG: hypothetical protein IT269_01600 [Saprospiraceae bacterium]|nr:hypothetical protein [Saprospiraceae bacterium]